jgi:itaconate CoA-transferase
LGSSQHSSLNSPQVFWDHPQLQARQRWREIGSPVGPLQALVLPVTMQDVEPRIPRPAAPDD